jgi:hypothetical protein
MARTVDRLVRNQILFREVNERVREVLDRTDDALEFLCECSNEDCTETIPLSGAMYEHVRSRGNTFVVVHGHQRPDVERVVEERPGFVLVEKFVDEDLVLKTDPRNSG